MNNNVIAPNVAEGTVTGKQEGDITTEKVYTFRTLKSTDTFLMFKILEKINIKEFASCFDNDTVKQMVKKGKDASVVGISVVTEMANVVICNLPKCEEEIYQMLSNTSNLSVEEVKDLDFVTFVEMVVDFIKKPEFKDFLKVVSGLFKSEK